MELREVIEKLEVAKGYMLSVSFLGEDNDIEHFLLTENFQLLDMLPSHNETRNLIIEQLEKPAQDITVIK